ncbi:MAG: HAD-IC family P-type ATPase, partial [Atopobiaceae bacterium]|nr:HAD-IC family P-type ATPase [Atopobiaceae bacterium]
MQADNVPTTDGAALAARGLTSAQVAERIARGQVNVGTDVKTKSIPQILASHTFTLFNAVILALSIIVLTTGSLRNILFVFPAIFNIIIGAFQEIRSKRAIDALSVLAASNAHVIRNGEEASIAVGEIVLGDVVKLGRGDQVPADAVVLEGSASANESLLTGESTPIDKAVGDELLSGSFLDSGSVVCEVIRVGADGYAARINVEAKQDRRVSSEILDTLRGIIRVATILLVPIGAALFARTYAMEGDYSSAALSSVSAVVGMIPQGLVLLTSSVFAIAATRLAARKVLVQQLYCTEKLARVDVLCLDKTGTITSGARTFIGMRPQEGVSEEELAGVLACLMEAAGDDTNDTGRAIAAFTEGVAPIERPIRHVSFSSATKYSGCVTESGRAFVLGAAQFVLRGSYADHIHDLEGFGDMARVLVVGEADGFDEDGVLVGDARLLGVIALADEIRPTAADTIAFFRKQGVE